MEVFRTDVQKLNGIISEYFKNTIFDYVSECGENTYEEYIEMNGYTDSDLFIHDKYLRDMTNEWEEKYDICNYCDLKFINSDLKYYMIRYISIKRKNRRIVSDSTKSKYSIQYIMRDYTYHYVNNDMNIKFIEDLFKEFFSVKSHFYVLK